MQLGLARAAAQCKSTGGNLGGIGTIAGAVTIAAGASHKAVISAGPDGKGIGTLTSQSSLLFKANATYPFESTRTPQQR
jgi:hypothetical protein